MPISLVEQMRLASQWFPLLAYGQRFLAETDAAKRGVIIGEALQWLATKSETHIDDRLTMHFVNILRTPEGEGLVRELVTLGDVMVSAEAGR